MKQYYVPHLSNHVFHNDRMVGVNGVVNIPTGMLGNPRPQAQTGTAVVSTPYAEVSVSLFATKHKQEFHLRYLGSYKIIIILIHIKRTSIGKKCNPAYYLPFIMILQNRFLIAPYIDFVIFKAELLSRHWFTYFSLYQFEQCSSVFQLTTKTSTGHTSTHLSPQVVYTMTLSLLPMKWCNGTH